ncbi:MAG: GAF domain-containing sensor histidine kinase [Anaerolineae bacterium]|nr:GAF domain-containing sensor histidine kinase [Anaerolineae bacterium]
MNPAAREPLESDTAKLQQRNRELSILNAIAQALNAEVDLTQALHTALAQVAELLDLRTGWVWLISEETGQFYLAAAQALPPALENDPRRMDGASYCYCLDTYQSGDLEGAANVNVMACSRLDALVDGADGLRYHASIPLYAHGRQLGLLNVASADWRELSPDDLRLLYTVGDMLSIAVERARLFARSVQLGAVEERNRLAREIHDTLAQGLSAITLQLETAAALLESGADPARAQQAIDRALALTRANLDEARRSVLDLRAAPLEGCTLAEAVEALAQSAAEAAGLDLRFEATGGDQPLPLRVEVGLYRVAQEALNNVVRHAEAGQLAVSLTATPDAVRLVIEDDGRGFDAAAPQESRYGLTGMNERVRLLGGKLDLSTDPGAGTRVAVTVPLHEGSAAQ